MNILDKCPKIKKGQKVIKVHTPRGQEIITVETVKSVGQKYVTLENCPGEKYDVNTLRDDWCSILYTCSLEEYKEFRRCHDNAAEFMMKLSRNIGWFNYLTDDQIERIKNILNEK